MLKQRAVAVPEELAGLFSERCINVERLHFVDDEPIAFARSYLTAELAEVDWQSVEQEPLYSVLERVTGKPVIRADMAIRAREADKALAEHLGVKRGTALLVMQRTSWFEDQQCCDRTTFYIRPERYEFVLSGVFKNR